jgi:hypothetical protein
LVRLRCKYISSRGNPEAANCKAEIEINFGTSNALNLDHANCKSAKSNEFVAVLLCKCPFQARMHGNIPHSSIRARKS